MNLPKLTRGFKWYMEIKVINLMSYFIPIIRFYDKKTKKICPTVEIFLKVNFMISIIVHLPLRGCQLRCHFSMNTIISDIYYRTNEGNRGGF